jgi:hypothetical protein
MNLSQGGSRWAKVTLWVFATDALGAPLGTMCEVTRKPT